MKITVMTSDDRFITLDVDSEESVENVKALLEVETSVSLRQQQLQFNGKEVRNSDRLSAVGVREGDLMTMVVATAAAGASSNDLGINPDGSAVNPLIFQQRIRLDSQMMAQLLQNDPALAQAILGDDLDNLQRLLRERHEQRLQIRRKQEEELALLVADPFDIEAQKKIEASIQQKGIDENMEAALEYNPEGFARVVMLYVDMEVNGVPLKAFVDSGAQSTIISKDCAERCGCVLFSKEYSYTVVDLWLLRLLDRRYRGVAYGVGQSEILGRIHVAPIKIGHMFYHCSFTVLDASNMEFLFGLDMLRKHQCMIDLKDNVLRVGGGEVAVPFLQEKDLPAHSRMDEERLSSLASAGQGSAETSGSRERTAEMPSRVPISVPQRNINTQGADEAKITKLVELGFGRDAAIQALALFNGNEEQAAGFLFGGF